MPEMANGKEPPGLHRRTLGIVGAGQLARMTIEAASALGISVVLLAQDPNEAATELASQVLLGAPTDAGQLWALAARCDVMTFDHEHIDLDMLSTFENAGVAVRPGVQAMRHGVDKAHMRKQLAAIGIPVPSFEILHPRADQTFVAQIEAFASAHSWPVVVKASRGGYDGKGIWPVADAAAAVWVREQTRHLNVPLIVEPFISIDFELSALVVRRPSETLAWPVVETTQVDGVCREVVMPGRVTPDFAQKAQSIAVRIAESIGLIGVMAVEMFVSGNQLLVNEVALRPHNSGHWTMEGATTSQFENHVRAVFDLPLGQTAARSAHVASVNVFGSADEADPAQRLAIALAIPGTHVHLYGKQVRAGRKLGHVTVVGDNSEEPRARAWQAAVELGTPVLESQRPSVISQ